MIRFFLVSVTMGIFCIVPIYFLQAHSLQDSIVVHITDSGFEPSEIVIQKGDIVIFENTGQKGHWPASNIHPTHRVYPGTDIQNCGTGQEEQMFDACGGLKQGETYTFTFMEPGVWRYHDHLAPQLMGKITVEGVDSVKRIEDNTEKPKGFIVQILAAIKDFFVRLFENPFNAENDSTDLFPARLQEQVKNVSKKDTAFEGSKEIDPITCSDYSCFETYYQTIVEKQEITDAFDDLKVRYDENVLVRSLCHPLVHVIGRAAVQKYPLIAEAYTKGDHFCWSGYYHGVMEAILYQTTPQQLPETINAICDSVPGKAVYSFDYYNCVHGLGHGVMYITQNELFDALLLCDHLQGSWEQESCYGGVFMENVITTFEEDHFSRYLKPDEPLYPCYAVPKKNKRACYIMQTSYVLKVNGYNFVDAFAQCSAVEDPYRDTCYQSIGRDASGSTVSDVARTKAYCLLGKDDRQRTGCVVGAVKDFISYFHSDMQAKQLCNSFLAEDEELANICLFIGANYYTSFIPPPA